MALALFRPVTFRMNAGLLRSASENHCSIPPSSQSPAVSLTLVGRIARTAAQSAPGSGVPMARMRVTGAGGPGGWACVRPPAHAARRARLPRVAQHQLAPELDEAERTAAGVGTATIPIRSRIMFDTIDTGIAPPGVPVHILHGAQEMLPPKVRAFVDCCAPRPAGAAGALIARRDQVGPPP